MQEYLLDSPKRYNPKSRSPIISTNPNNFPLENDFLPNQFQTPNPISIEQQNAPQNQPIPRKKSKDYKTFNLIDPNFQLSAQSTLSRSSIHPEINKKNLPFSTQEAQSEIIWHSDSEEPDYLPETVKLQLENNQPDFVLKDQKNILSYQLPINSTDNLEISQITESGFRNDHYPKNRLHIIDEENSFELDISKTIDQNKYLLHSNSQSLIELNQTFEEINNPIEKKQKQSNQSKIFKNNGNVHNCYTSIVTGLRESSSLKSGLNISSQQDLFKGLHSKTKSEVGNFLSEDRFIPAHLSIRRVSTNSNEDICGDLSPFFKPISEIKIQEQTIKGIILSGLNFSQTSHSFGTENITQSEVQPQTLKTNLSSTPQTIDSAKKELDKCTSEQINNVQNIEKISLLQQQKQKNISIDLKNEKTNNFFDEMKPNKNRTFSVDSSKSDSIESTQNPKLKQNLGESTNNFRQSKFNQMINIFQNTNVILNFNNNIIINKKQPKNSTKSSKKSASKKMDFKKKRNPQIYFKEEPENDYFPTKEGPIKKSVEKHEKLDDLKKNIKIFDRSKIHSNLLILKNPLEQKMEMKTTYANIYSKTNKNNNFSSNSVKRSISTGNSLFEKIFFKSDKKRTYEIKKPGRLSVDKIPEKYINMTVIRGRSSERSNPSTFNRNSNTNEKMIQPNIYGGVQRNSTDRNAREMNLIPGLKPAENAIRSSIKVNQPKTLTSLPDFKPSQRKSLIYNETFSKNNKTQIYVKADFNKKSKVKRISTVGNIDSQLSRMNIDKITKEKNNVVYSLQNIDESQEKKGFEQKNNKFTLFKNKFFSGKKNDFSKVKNNVVQLKSFCGNESVNFCSQMKKSRDDLKIGNYRWNLKNFEGQIVNKFDHFVPSSARSSLAHTLVNFVVNKNQDFLQKVRQCQNSKF